MNRGQRQMSALSAVGIIGKTSELDARENRYPTLKRRQHHVRRIKTMYEVWWEGGGLFRTIH